MAVQILLILAVFSFSFSLGYYLGIRREQADQRFSQEKSEKRQLDLEDWIRENNGSVVIEISRSNEEKVH